MDQEQNTIIGQLQMLHKEVAKQNSLSWMFLTGIVYGIGFFIGSAIIATIALGVLGPWIGEIPWVQNAFTTGQHLLGK